MAALRGRLLFRVLLAVALLAPASVLFAQVWQSAADKETFAARERDGVTYLLALGRLSTALAQADAAATAGQAAPSEMLARVLDTVTTVDQRLGDRLRSHERWADLRVKIQALPRAGADLAAIDSAYHTVGDLLVDLYAKVQTTSNLILDPVADTYYLQAIAAAELPGAVVAAAHLVDLATIAAGEPAGQVSGLLDLAAARADALSPTDRTMAALTLAEEATTSTTLGSSLVGPVDKFQLAVETLISSTATATLATTVRQDLARLRQARDGLVAAASGLSTSVLAELDRLLANRLADLRPQQRVALAALAAAVLLAVLTILLSTGRPMRGRRAPGREAVPGGIPADAGAAPADLSWPGRASPDGARLDAGWRERSGAAR
ncbi:MAG: hypothetical protein V7603_2538 [Micromonosporaceae bacterium]